MTFLRAMRSQARKTSTALQKTGGSLSRSSTELTTSTSIFVGAEIPVGEFFWIDDFDLIGFDRDAEHGNGGKHDSGSVCLGCTITVRGIENDYAIVRLNRSEMPYGAEAPGGVVFQIPISQIQTWPDKIRSHNDHERQRRKLAKQYCR